MARDEVSRVIHRTLLGEALAEARVAALLADERGQYVAVNEQACLLTGYTAEQLTGFRAGELAADEASREIYERLVSRRKLQGRKLIRRSDGGTVACRYWGIPTTIASMPYFIVLLWRSERRSAARA